MLAIYDYGAVLPDFYCYNQIKKNNLNHLWLLAGN